MKLPAQFFVLPLSHAKQSPVQLLAQSPQPVLDGTSEQINPGLIVEMATALDVLANLHRDPGPFIVPELSANERSRSAASAHPLRPMMVGSNTDAAKATHTPSDRGDHNDL